MKNLFLTIIFVAVATVTFGQLASSAHDFSGAGWSNNEICLPCHTPHNADLTVANAPLWNHAVSAATYTLYSGPGTMQATPGQPSGISKLCLSCHDGTVALDNLINPNQAGSTFIDNGNNDSLGVSLENDHPISFVYNQALATSDGGLFDPSAALSGPFGGTIEQDMLFGATTAATLECASCHDVHNEYNLTSLLKVDNAGSGLCLTCHDK